MLRFSGIEHHAPAAVNRLGRDLIGIMKNQETNRANGYVCATQSAQIGWSGYLVKNHAERIQYDRDRIRLGQGTND